MSSHPKKSRYILRVEGVNLANVIDDTDQLSVRRGGGLMILNAPASLKQSLEEKIGNRLTEIATGASIGLFVYEAESEDRAETVRKAVEKHFREGVLGYKTYENEDETLSLKHGSFVVDVVRIDRLPNEQQAEQQATAKNRWRQLQQPTLSLEGLWNGPAKINDFCYLDRTRPAEIRLDLNPEEKQKPISRTVRDRWHYGRGARQQFYQTELARAAKEDAAFAKILGGLAFTDDLEKLSGRPDKTSSGETNSEFPVPDNLIDKLAVFYVDGNGFGQRGRKIFQQQGSSGFREWSTALRNHHRNLLKGLITLTDGDLSCPGVDSPMARDRFGRFMLPFSLIKGKVLDALVDLETDSEFRKTWLGAKSADGSYDPERGRLWFSDFHTEQTGQPDNVIERIQIDPETRTVRNGMLQMLQAPFGYGEEVTFQGTIGFIADKNEADEVEKQIDLALRWVPAYGANRTVGFGRTKRVETSLEKHWQPSFSSVLPWRLRLDRPLCLVGRKHSQNHFESLEVIGGAVLKGAIANLLLSVTGSSERVVSQDVQGDFPKLCEHFENVRFSEARPLRDDPTAKRPVEPPLSIVVSPTKKDEFFDVAICEEPGLIDGAAPAFLPDWKDADFGLICGAFGWTPLPKERRIRTAIDPETGRAVDEQLFSYGLVLPDRKTEAGVESFVWEGNIGLEDVPEDDQATIRNELQQLLQYGLPAIGKTRAIAAIEWLTSPTSPAVGTATLSNDLVVITLQTECLMTDPETLQKNNHDMEPAYKEFWNEISGGSLNLKRYFARQSLYGGYVSRRADAKKYEPFLLTDRGSVFVLHITDQATAEPLIEKWQQTGLPISKCKWIQARYAPNGVPLWQRCPYLPQNGYGEIAVDLECHTTHFTEPAIGAKKETA